MDEWKDAIFHRLRRNCSFDSNPVIVLRECDFFGDTDKGKDRQCICCATGDLKPVADEKVFGKFFVGHCLAKDVSTVSIELAREKGGLSQRCDCLALVDLLLGQGVWYGIGKGRRHARTGCCPTEKGTAPEVG